MNSFEGKITRIERSGDLSLVTVRISPSIELASIIIETQDHWKTNSDVLVLFKETEVILGSLESGGISIQNRIPARVTGVKDGKLLSEVSLQTEGGSMVAVVPTNSVHALGVKKDLELIAMVKINEIMLSER